MYMKYKNYLILAITWLQIMKTTCNSGASSVSEARGCVDSMASGSVRTSCENGLEELGGSLVSPLSSVNDGNVLKIFYF